MSNFLTSHKKTPNSLKSQTYDILCKVEDVLLDVCLGRMFIAAFLADDGMLRRVRRTFDCPGYLL